VGMVLRLYSPKVKGINKRAKLVSAEITKKESVSPSKSYLQENYVLPIQMSFILVDISNKVYVYILTILLLNDFKNAYALFLI
jgi:hypothetical protein